MRHTHTNGGKLSHLSPTLASLSFGRFTHALIGQLQVNKGGKGPGTQGDDKEEFGENRTPGLHTNRDKPLSPRPLQKDGVFRLVSVYHVDKKREEGVSCVFFSFFLCFWKFRSLTPISPPPFPFHGGRRIPPQACHTGINQ